ncbi:WYL domain-containing protein [Pikeienuella piscinae]|uniref:WYL domain-containing protein n=1 Tax=Pikeienuella piscinae TaxID=2748098 RepID=A0A7L5BX82_9RHOB|nr:WYL domain-containing protein [Pikeienuella piscinae]QIE54856.1 WYL domain-containing protein [Pikeienuella piscinae]
MRRAGRLFRLIEELHGRRLALTAATLAANLEVSPRTIYRDIAALRASGAPIDGEAGVGYRLDKSYHLPPLILDGDEALALLAGLSFTRAFTDDELAHAAERAETKIRAVLDDAGLRRADRSPYETPARGWTPDQRALHLKIRKACEARVKLKIDYRDETGAPTGRVVHPYLLVRWRAVWTLVAWCELRAAERHFRIDRIERAERLDEGFADPPPALRAELRAWADGSEPDGRRARVS